MATTKEQKIDLVCRSNPFRGRTDLPEPPRPSDQGVDPSLPLEEQVRWVQEQLNILTYNHLPTTFFSLEKQRSLQSILLTSKEILSDALPIRCLEATFVGLFLTQGVKSLSRIPLSFKSTANGELYRHIVLVVQHKGRPLYGALGLSRKSTLMFKEMKFASLYDLVMDYRKEYSLVGHTLLDIKIGLGITHDSHSRDTPCWRFVSLKVDQCLNERSSQESFSNGLEEFLSNYGKILPLITEQFYKGLNTLDGASRASRLCFLDLDCAEKDAGMENQRRISLISKGQSPLSGEARRAAADRELRPAKKGANTTKRATTGRNKAPPDPTRATKNSAAVNVGTTPTAVTGTPPVVLHEVNSLPSTPRNCSSASSLSTSLHGV